MTPSEFFVLPLDGRPVCYDQVLDLADIAGLQVILPPRELLGVLKQPAPLDALWTWCREQLAKSPQSALIVSLDTLAYGGLIAGRVNTEPLEVLQNRVQGYFQDIPPSHHPRYGFSSILRIPDYNNAEEEPDYWAEYGSLLHQFSVETHQQQSMPEHLFSKIPGAVIQDFLSRREKNFQLNQTFIDFLPQQQLDFLIFCQDDTGPYGLNVQEAVTLKSQIQKRQLQHQVTVQTGADEAALTLLAKALWAQSPQPPKVFPWFFPEHGKKLMAKFDGIPVGNIVQRHVQTVGGTLCISPYDADLILLVNAPADQMGDHCAQTIALRPRADALKLVEIMQTWIPKNNVALADVVYANGADPVTMTAMLSAHVPINQLAGYGAWNTPGNAIGTALAMGLVSAWARRNNRFNEEACQRLLFKRFLDDWYYQSEVRIRLRRGSATIPSQEVLNQAMHDGVEALKPAFKGTDYQPSFSFPCHRFFEVAVHL